MSKRSFHWLSLAAVALGAFGLAVALRSGAAEPVNGTPPPGTKTAGSRVTHVTVYPTNALVTREVEVPAGAGTFELVVTPLPPQTVNSSLYSEGSEGIRILTTRFRTRPIREDTREEVRKLEDEQRRLFFACQRIEADVTAIEQNLKMLAKLEDFKARDNSESIIALSKYVMDCRAEKNKELVALQQQRMTNQEQSEFVKRKFQELTAGTSKVERDAVIVVDKSSASTGKVRLNYLVDAAAWRPQYKLRAAKDEKGTVLVEYLASIVQQSGEDWNGVQVTLSTAAPALNAAPPDLKMLEVAVIPRGTAAPMPTGISKADKSEFSMRGKELRGQGQEQYLQKNAGNAAKFINDAAAVEATWQLLYCSREEVNSVMKGHGSRDGSEEGPSVTYHIPTRISVPSRADEQMIEVAKIEMKPDYFYKTVPVLAAHVYRQANLTNESKYVLLPGEATMYQGTDFVGRMNMPLVAIGEQFTAGFGVDPQLQVQRVMEDKERATQGGNQVHKFKYRILVSSYKSEAVNLQVWDRLPHAETESVGISLLKVTPELSKDALYVRENRPQNLLRWDMKIDPAMNGEKALTINYEFQMALDKQMTIGSFQTK